MVGTGDCLAGGPSVNTQLYLKVGFIPNILILLIPPGKPLASVLSLTFFVKTQIRGGHQPQNAGLPPPPPCYVYCTRIIRVWYRSTECHVYLTDLVLGCNNHAMRSSILSPFASPNSPRILPVIGLYHSCSAHMLTTLTHSYDMIRGVVTTRPDIQHDMHATIRFRSASIYRRSSSSSSSSAQ